MQLSPVLVSDLVNGLLSKGCRSNHSSEYLLLVTNLAAAAAGSIQ